VKGANPCDEIMAQSTQRNALTIAVQNNDVPMMSLLLEHTKGAGLISGSCLYSYGRYVFNLAPETKSEAWSYIPLAYMAIINKNYEMVKLLLRYDASMESASSGQNPFHWACVNGDLDGIKILLEKYPHLVNTKWSGEDGYHLAKKELHDHICNFLLPHKKILKLRICKIITRDYKAAEILWEITANNGQIIIDSTEKLRNTLKWFNGLPVLWNFHVMLHIENNVSINVGSCFRYYTNWGTCLKNQAINFKVVLHWKSSQEKSIESETVQFTYNDDNIVRDV